MRIAPPTAEGVVMPCPEGFGDRLDLDERASATAEHICTEIGAGQCDIRAKFARGTRRDDLWSSVKAFVTVRACGLEVL